MHKKDCCYYVVTKTVQSVTGESTQVIMGDYYRLEEAYTAADSVNVDTGDCISISIDQVSVARVAFRSRFENTEANTY